MNSILKKAGLGIVLAATAITASAPAEAQRYRGGYGGYYGRGYRHDDGGTALVAGIAGLAIGAAIASGHDRYRDRYYADRGYDRGYDRNYDRGYYPRQGYYGYDRGYSRCFVERRWDGYYRRDVRVRVCR